MTRYLSIALAATLIGAATPAPAPAQQQSKASERDQQLLAELARKWEAAYNRKDAAGVAALYTEKAVEVSPLGIIQGRDAVQKRVEGDLQAGGHDLSISIDHVEVSGNLEWSAGGWRADYGSQPVHGYWSQVAIRDGDMLKIQQNAFNVSMPAPPAQAPDK